MRYTPAPFDPPFKDKVMRHQDSKEPDVVPSYLDLLARQGQPRPEQVLDFGAGLGRHVREWCRLGFDAWGVDVDTPSITKNLANYDKDTSRIRLYDAPGRAPVPFDDDSFDLVVSSSTMEHVLDFEWAFREQARILRPAGAALHVFPARWRPVECHTAMPLGGRFHPPWACWAFARFGRGTAKYRDFSVAEAARLYREFFATGTNYLTARQVVGLAKQHFGVVTWAERDFIASTADISQLSKRLVRWVEAPGLDQIYRGLHTRVLLLREPHE